MIFIFGIVSILFYGPILIYSPTIKTLMGDSENNIGIIISGIISALVCSILILVCGFVSEVKNIGLKKTTLFCYAFGILFSILMLSFMKDFEYWMSSYLAITGAGFNVTLTIASTVYPTKIRDFALGFLYSILRAVSYTHLTLPTIFSV